MRDILRSSSAATRPLLLVLLLALPSAPAQQHAAPPVATLTAALQSAEPLRVRLLLMLASDDADDAVRSRMLAPQADVVDERVRSSRANTAGKNSRLLHAPLAGAGGGDGVGDVARGSGQVAHGASGVGACRAAWHMLAAAAAAASLAARLNGDPRGGDAAATCASCRQWRNGGWIL